MRNGVLLIDKPAGVTSAGVVARVKRALKASRVGHAGTLDPDATGLLVILINGATKVASYAADGDKIYSGTIKLGVRTDTDDTSGRVLSSSEDLPAFGEVERAAQQFVGAIQQVPPKVSAIKVGGKRAHRLQRRGAEFELEARTVTVRRFLLSPAEEGLIRYEIECSPGTYVRSLARDLGEALGCGGAAASIRRERSAHLKVADAIQLEQVSWELVRDWSVLLPETPRIELPATLAAALHNGQRTALGEAARLPQLSERLKHPGIVMYSTLGDSETLGLLRVSEDGKLQFELNLGRVSP